MSDNYTINLTPKSVIVFFLSIVIILFSIDMYTYFNGLHNYDLFDEDFNMAAEHNVPTLLSVTIVMLIGFISYLKYYETKKYGWLITSIFFIYMGIDDGLVLHEQLAHIFEDTISDVEYASYPWHMIVLPFFAFFGAFIVLFLLKEFYETKCKQCIFLLLFGFFLYAVAIGLDYYEGMEEEYFYLMGTFRTLFIDDIEHLLYAVEEAIEMIGSTFILAAILREKSYKVTFNRAEKL